MYRCLMIALTVLLVASFSSTTYAGKGDQTQDRIQAKDGTGANCPNDGVCDGTNCPGCPDCDEALLLGDQDPDQDQTQARDGTGANCPTGGTCDGTGPHGPRR